MEGEAGLPVIRELTLTSGGLVSYHGNQWRSGQHPAPLIRTVHSWGLGQVPKEDQSHASAQVKQALVRQGMDRGQENSHRLSGLTTQSLLAHHAAVHPQTSLDKDLFNQWKNTQSSGFLQFRCQLGRGQPSSTPAAQDRPAK